MRLEELYQDIQPKIYAFFYMKTSCRETAEDLTQEVFYEAVKGGRSYSGQASIKTWLFGIAKNKLSNYYRSKRYKADLKTRLENEPVWPQVSAEDAVIRQEEQAYLLHLIRRLDEIPREIVTLRLYGECSFQEIGLLIGRSENYARVAFHRAKLALHKELEGFYGS